MTPSGQLPLGDQGGVCMTIAEPWRAAIVDRGVVVPGRALTVGGSQTWIYEPS